MGLFSKKKSKEMDLPPLPDDMKNDLDFAMPSPPPLPPLAEMRDKGDFPAITSEKEELPIFPEVPPEEDFQNMPEEEEVIPAPKPIPKRTTAGKESTEPLLRPQPKAAPKVQYAKHLFVSIQDYQQVNEHVNQIRDSIKETDEVLARLHEIKKDQEEGFASWQKQLEDAEQKLHYVDQMLFQGE